MGNEIIKQLNKFAPSIMGILQDGKKSRDNDSLWDVIDSLCKAGNYVARSSFSYRYNLLVS